MMNLMSLCDYPWWLWTLLPFVLGLALAALLWRHYKDKYHSAQLELTNYKRKFSSMEEMLNLSRKKKGDLDGLLAISEGKQHQLERQLAKQSAGLVSSIGLAAPVVEQIVMEEIVEPETTESEDSISELAQESQPEEIVESPVEEVEESKEELAEAKEETEVATEEVPEAVEEDLSGIDADIPMAAAIAGSGIAATLPEEQVDLETEDLGEGEPPVADDQENILEDIAEAPEESPDEATVEEPIVVASKNNSEDDYLDCREYEAKGLTDETNNIALFQHENGNLYFVVYYSNGTVRLRSEGYGDSEIRDQSLSQVVKLVNNREMYRKIQKGKYYIDVLYNGEGKEIGRSCLKKEFIPFTAAKAATVTVGATSIVATDTDESPVSDPILPTKKTSLPNKNYDALGLENLKVIEGIGPKMESILNENGIDSLQELAESSDIRIEAILSQFGARYQMMDTSQWISQAKLASEGNWEGLIDMQKGIGGKLGKPTDSKVEKMMIKKGLIRQWKENDLKAIEGVGPKIAQLLIKNKIYNWDDLSNTSIADLQTILDAAGKSYMLADPSTWPKQASLAAEGKFDELEEFQDQIK